MDCNAAIEKNREALKSILATLVVMAGLGSPGSALPRRLYNAVLRLLRPAEAAARRLIIVAARGIAVPPPGQRKPRPRLIATEPILRKLGIAVVLSSAEIAAHAAADRAAAARAAKRRSFPTRIGFPLFDPLRQPFRLRRQYVPAQAVPRILSFSGSRPAPIPRPPSPDDPLDLTRLGLRFQALGRVLDDLPGQARRFARWRSRVAARAQEQATRAAARARRVWPLKPGSPPGLPRRATRLRPFHEVHDVLRVTHGLAVWAMERRDTS